MAQKRRKPSKEAGFEYLTVMIPSEFRAALMAQAEAEDRTLSDVTRRRLLGPSDDPHSPQARAFGSLIAILFQNLSDSSRPDKTAKMLAVAAPKLLNHFGSGKDLEQSEKDQAENFGEHLWLRLSNAHEPTFTDGQRALMTDEQRVLLNIKKQLIGDAGVA